MAVRVVFVDTSILCNILSVPGRDQAHDDVVDQFRSRVAEKQTFVLPLTTLIETGNHIHHAGADRRGAAERFAEVTRQIVHNRAPRRLNEVEWGTQLLTRLLEGDGAGQALVDLLDGQLGAGDVSILVERDDFVERSSYSRDQVEVWSLDLGLSAHG